MRSVKNDSDWSAESTTSKYYSDESATHVDLVPVKLAHIGLTCYPYGPPFAKGGPIVTGINAPLALSLPLLVLLSLASKKTNLFD